MFGMIISQILGSSSPVNDILALLGLILDPIKTLVNGLGSFLFYDAIGESDSKSVVDLHWSGRLGMPHFLKSLAERDGFLPIDVGSSHFCFSRRAHDVAQYFGNDMDRSVWWTLGGISSIGREEKTASSATARLWCRKVGSITVNVKDHVAAPKTHGGIGMSGSIVEELGEGIKSLLCSLFLKGRQIAKCSQNCVFHRDGVI